MTKRINKVLELVAKLSFATRGLFGEGTQALGNFFQVSNQVSLGISESEIFNNLSGVIAQIREQELDARGTLSTKYKVSLEDNIFRALGLLTSARLITSSETLQHLSALRLGIDLGIIKNLKTGLVNNLFIITQPAHLQKFKGKRLTEEERDYIRAAILREKLEGGINV
jgi:protein arginine kinase